MKTFRLCPYRYQQEYLTESFLVDETPVHFSMGNAFEKLVTEGVSEFEKEFKIMPPRAKRTGASGKIELTNSDGAILMSGYEEALRQPLFELYETNYREQETIYAYFVHKGKKLKLKGTMDRVDFHSCIRDFKFVDSLLNFKKNLFEGYNYAAQACWYNFLVFLERGTSLPFFFDVTDKTKQNKSCVYELPEDVMIAERAEMQHSLEQIVEAHMSGEFPAVSCPKERERTCFKCPFYKKCEKSLQKKSLLINP